jgi:NADH:quinone reductase (non-electrogenic)
MADSDSARVTLVNSADFFLYLPLLPEVAAGILDPRRVSVPLAATLPGVRCVFGEARSIDRDMLVVRPREGEERRIDYDRLVIAVGSVRSGAVPLDSASSELPTR